MFQCFPIFMRLISVLSELVLTFLKGHQIEKWVYYFFIMSEGYLEWKDREMNQALEMLDEKMNLLYKRLDNI